MNEKLNSVAFLVIEVSSSVTKESTFRTKVCFNILELPCLVNNIFNKWNQTLNLGAALFFEYLYSPEERRDPAPSTGNLLAVLNFVPKTQATTTFPIIHLPSYSSHVKISKKKMVVYFEEDTILSAEPIGISKYALRN